MKERKSKYGLFWGCSRFPKCRGVIDIEGKKRKGYPANRIIKKPPPKEAESSVIEAKEVILENNHAVGSETAEPEAAPLQIQDTYPRKFQKRKSGFSIIQFLKFFVIGFFFPKRKRKVRRVRWYAHSSLTALPLIAIVFLAIGAGILTLRPYIQRFIASQPRKPSSSKTQAKATQSLADKEFHLEPCTLIEVTDGDTIKIRWKNEICYVRLLRINTPEKHDLGYVEATKALESLVHGKALYLEFEHLRVYNRDVYNRLLAYVHAEDKNINIEMVRLGWTSFWTKYGKGKYEEAFIAAEKEALQTKQGLWKSRK